MTSPAFDSTATRRTLTATIAGEIDISNASELRRSIDAQLADTTTVIIDLSATTFVDSTGVALAPRHGESASHDP